MCACESVCPNICVCRLCELGVWRLQWGEGALIGMSWLHGLCMCEGGRASEKRRGDLSQQQLSK